MHTALPGRESCVRQSSINCGFDNLVGAQAQGDDAPRTYGRAREALIQGGGVPGVTLGLDHMSR